jgi:hypothetical protein
MPDPLGKKYQLLSGYHKASLQGLARSTANERVER